MQQSPRCSLTEFEAALLTHFGPSAESSPGPRASAPVTLGAEITGTYAVYSLAWSPHFGGRILRASLQISRLPNGAIRAEYREDLPIGATIFRGDALVTGRTLHLPLHGITTGLPLFMSFATPGTPVAVLCGVQCGSALLSHSVEPVAGRILLVRLRNAKELHASNRYLALGETVTSDLVVLGLSAPPEMEAQLTSMLGRVDRVTVGEQAWLAEWFDSGFLEG